MDPFVGGGTTALASIMNNRMFKGCDISEEYVIISKRRVQNVQIRLG